MPSIQYSILLISLCHSLKLSIPLEPATLVLTTVACNKTSTTSTSCMKSFVNLTNLSRKLYKLKQFSLTTRNSNSYNLLNQSSLPEFDQLAYLSIELEFNTSWKGDILISISSLQKPNNISQFTLRRQIDPVFPNSFQEINAREINDIISLLQDAQKQDTPQGIFCAVVRSFRLIAHLLLPFFQPITLLLYLGPEMMMPNCYYFTALVNLFHFRNRVREYSLQSNLPCYFVLLTGCEDCEDVYSYQVFYAFNFMDRHTWKPFALQSADFSGSLLYDCDFTLLFLLLLVLPALVFKILLKRPSLVNNYLLFPYMEGATFELMLFSYSSLLATTKTTIQAESIISAIISLLLILMFTPFSLRPLVYIGANLASDQYQLFQNEPQKQENIQVLEAPSAPEGGFIGKLAKLKTAVRRLLQTGSQKKSVPKPIKSIRRGTAYPGKANSQQQQTQLPEPQHFNILQKRIFNYFAEQKSPSLALLNASLYQVELLNSLMLGTLLPFLSKDNCKISLIVSICFQIVIFLISTYMIVVLIKNRKTISERLPLYKAIGISLGSALIICAYSLFIIQQAKQKELINESARYNENFDNYPQDNKFQENYFKSNGEDFDQIYFVGNVCIGILIGYLLLQVTLSIYQFFALITGFPAQKNKNEAREEEKKTEKIKKPIKKRKSDGEVNIVQPTLIEIQNPSVMLAEEKAKQLDDLEMDSPQDQVSEYLQTGAPKAQFSSANSVRKGKEFDTQDEAESEEIESNNTAWTRLDADGKVLVPFDQCLDYSKIFNEGTVLLGNKELVCHFAFNYQITFNGEFLDSFKSMKAIKNLNEGNASMFMKALRINGTHAITLQNANRVGPITLSNVQLRIYQAGKLIQKDLKFKSKVLKAGESYQFIQESSFDFASPALSNDKITVKGAYSMKGLEMSKKIHLEFANSDLKLIKVTGYSQTDFDKAQSRGPQVSQGVGYYSKAFELLFEQKTRLFGLKNVVAYIQHHQLLQYNIEETEVQVSAFFGKIRVVMASSPYICFHLIIELSISRSSASQAPSKKYREKDEYVMVSLFQKKSRSLITYGHKQLMDSFGQELCSYFRQID